MKALAAPIRAKLAAMLPRLATNHDGEVVATARAIGRTLGSAGNDWHDLAAVVALEAPIPVGAEDRTRASSAGQHPAAVWDKLPIKERLRWLNAMAETNLLTDWEAEFITSIRFKYEQRGSLAKLSTRQVETLSRILWKVVKEGVHP